MMEKRVCLLTGAAGTLGSAFCRLYAPTYHIAAVYHRTLPQVPSQFRRFIDPLDPHAALPENEHPVFAIQADLTDERDLERVVDLTLARFERIDLLVNAAVHSIWGPLIESSRLLKSFDRQFQVNTGVPFKLAWEVARKFWRFRDRENEAMNRNVVNVSSTAGLNIYPDTGQSVYSASKAALNQLTYHMAHEFQDFKVRVNATAPDSFPGIVPTERAAETILRLDEGTMTGKILLLDRQGDRLLDAPSVHSACE